MVAGFLPLLTSPSPELVDTLNRIGQILVPSNGVVNEMQPSCIVLPDSDSPATAEQVIQWLDQGAEKVVITVKQAKDLIGSVQPERLLLLLDAANVSAVSEKLRNSVSGVLLKVPTLDVDFLTAFRRFFPQQSSILVLPASPTVPSTNTLQELAKASATLVLQTDFLTLSETTSSAINVAEAFLAPLTSDRPDGLIPTIVSSYNQGGKALGLVYSSHESVKESILTGRGVYQSRKHGLWRKGETSGATQEVVRIKVDCDSDALEFQVVQHGSGFCHLETPTCFGGFSGLSQLEATLKSRFSLAPEGSYTRKLFDDPNLLRSKIMEEADELCRAQTREEVAFEAADLLYFALVKCISQDVSISDVEESLDRKAKKVTRRPGGAKPQWESTSASAPPQLPPPSPSPSATHSTQDQIKMRQADLSQLSSSERSKLLQRPVLRSDEMIAKAKPIIDSVRQGGDNALKALTAKFDKVQLDEVILRPPFPPESMALTQEVREAIDVAYDNIFAFHEAQSEKEPLVVETMPGVVCTRFARPIARVGLYVPGGTAILPSTALMLGIPAKVAGCREIVLAVPPRPDGSVSPEVLYVAHRVGVSAVLKAGGAQAVAAMAYGTETVPKVDKIFGPGNQWVTAAKMYVQNDTDALVAIDMPAGPSEVLVIADSTANPTYVASDLLSQAEHGVDSQVVLVGVNLSDEHQAQIEEEIDRQAKALPRVDIVRQSIPKSIVVRASSIEEAVRFSNDYAPEHLILHLQNAPDIVRQVENAGSVFVGPYSPESCGDYASGTNHTLPTNGYARQFSGVNTLSFQKHITSQQVSKDGLKKLGPVVITLAECEGLEAHANAVRVRMRQIE